MPYFENSNMGVALGQDPPAILVDAIAFYRNALVATRHEDEKIQAERLKQRQNQK